ncbi:MULTISPECIES: hypothetical protein [unclassified Pasteurella]|uniref:hypothetical protein n=1 Tax=unclassified Pasteurella TaxID=2621516 RepID=UPI001073B939|nr:hypothetical protein [Pasteurella sp. 19428wF3_WM03]TFU51054.1 hypothetical protein E4T92_06740 [Pasteurella sp. WM03]
MKKTAAAAIVALMLSGCKIFGSSGSHTPQPIEPVPTVKAIDYSKQSVQQLEQSATTAQKVLSDSQTKLTQVETQITEINRRITTLNQEISVLEKAEKPDANALKEKRDALAEANQALTVQNKILVVAQQDVKQAQINVTNVQNILIEKKAEQNKPPVVVVPDNPSQPSQPTQPEQPSEPEQPSQPSQPEIPSMAEGDRVITLYDGKAFSNDPELKYKSVRAYSQINKSSLSVNNTDIEMDIGKLSNYQYGLHRGGFTHPDLIVNDGTGKNQLNYTIVNQPYSFYGVLADNDQGYQFLSYVDNTFINKNSPELLRGSATYKGDVMATYTVEGKYVDKAAYEDYRQHKSNYSYIDIDPYSPTDDGSLRALYRKDIVTFNEKDGTIELKADFDKERISGYLNSDSIGRVRLSETDLLMDGYTGSFSYRDGKTLETDKLKQGTYVGLGSTNRKEVAGEIKIEFEEQKLGGEFGTYQAVYGATAQ